MNRRNFIQLTGASLVTLLVSDYVKAKGITSTVIQMPDEVKILLNDNFIMLQSSDKKTWAYKDVVVKLEDHKDLISVFIQSPTLALKEVQLLWKYAIGSQAKVVGDAWERTYGDIRWQSVDSSQKMPWYFVEHNDEHTICFGVKTGCAAFCYWQVADNNLRLNLDTRNGGNGVQLGNRTLHAADIVTAKNKSNENLFNTIRHFCKQMCDMPRTVKQPVYGINDWYFAYGNNSAQLILQHTALLAPLATNTSNKPFSVVDMGWMDGTDNAKPNEKFGDMQKLTNEIKKLGMCPGIWTRPLLGRGDENKNLFIKNLLPDNTERNKVFDPTIEENIEHVKKIFELYNQWGFEMVKHDYSTEDIFGKWGFEMTDAMTVASWQFNDNSKTNAEIILNLYKAIRQAAGNTYLIGCNTISHLSAGLFELNRIGDDTSGKEWARTKKMGVNTMAFRMAQHKTFYEADGDCVGLTTAIPWEKNKQWMQLLAQSSAPLFISAQPEAVGTEQKEFIKQCFAEASKPQSIGEPLDWLTNMFPTKWKLNDRVVDFNWD